MQRDKSINNDSTTSHPAAPPPPPPPPPPLQDHLSKTSSSNLKLRTAPPTFSYQPPASLPATVDPSPAPTGPYFFYGTLSDPSMLREILGLDHGPEFRPGYISGYERMLWGQYPALLPTTSTSASTNDENSIVEGVIYYVETVEYGEKLAAYETRNYQPQECWITYTDGREPLEESGWVFVFVGDKRDLSEGSFDLEVWLRRMGRDAVADKTDA